ncbi:MAG: flagellar hook-basal body complex protein FliE [Oscillospiraceae bacterium]|nr:flagellar hook-basal body complex protein FliE [Oscillospiraceae bacterium]
MYLVPISSLTPISSIQDVPENTSSESGQASFKSIMQDALNTLQESQQAAAEDSYNLAMGDISSLHSLMINSAMEATAVETVVQLTSRAVSTYKEIMQMQI